MQPLGLGVTVLGFVATVLFSALFVSKEQSWLVESKSGFRGGSSSYRSSYRRSYTSYRSTYASYRRSQVDCDADDEECDEINPIIIYVLLFVGVICLAVYCGYKRRKRLSVAAGNNVSNSAEAMPLNQRGMRSGGNQVAGAPVQEYRDAQQFQNMFPIIRTRPGMNPPGLPVMAHSPYATPAVRSSVHVFGPTLEFANVNGVEDRCVQSTAVTSGYYEVTLEAKDPGTVVAIGFATRPYPPFRLPGWDWHSIGFHSDNGHVFFDDNHNGKHYASPFRQGEVIGCGFNGTNYFFTVNGRPCGNAVSTPLLDHEQYATIGADGPCRMRVNFGDSPFVWAQAMRPNYPPPMMPPPQGYSQQQQQAAVQIQNAWRRQQSQNPSPQYAMPAYAQAPPAYAPAASPSPSAPPAYEPNSNFGADKV